MRERESSEAITASYRQLAEIYHDLLSLETLDQLLERLVKTVRSLIPVSSVLIVEARTHEQVLIPLFTYGTWPAGFLDERLPFGEGLIGLAVERGRAILANEAHQDPRAGHVAGTSEGDPEAIISLPLVARGVVIGAMSLYREGRGSSFSAFEFELAQRFADAATLALENARTRSDLRELTRRDELTGLLNRRGFNDLLQSTLARPEPVSLLLLDVDDLKRINDVHGHMCGDEVLRHLARQMVDATRFKDCVCRLGGDEFAIVLAGAAAGESAAVIARVERALAATPLLDVHGPVTVSVSIGSATSAEMVAPTAEMLLREADRAMYGLKRRSVRRGLGLVGERSD